MPYTYSHLGAGAELVSVFHALTIMWERFPDFQHGMLVPPLCAVLIYLRRKELATLPLRGWAPGLLLVILSLAVYWAGRRVDNQYTGFLSLQLLLATLVLWIGGWRWLAALAFPIAFLTFAWPLPFLDNLVAFPLRVAMSWASVFILRVFGLDAIQQGTAIISAPQISLGLGPGGAFAVDVADPCSGIRSLFALTMVSALYGYFSLKSPWKRLALFLSAIPLAVAGNLARILCLTFGTIVLGPETAIGTLEHPSLFHSVAGYVVFIVALFGMLALTALLNSQPHELRQRWNLFKNQTRAELAREISPAKQAPASASRQTDIY